MIRIVKVSVFILVFELIAIVFQTTTHGSELPNDLPTFKSPHFFNIQSENESFEHFERYFSRFLRYWHIKGASVAVSHHGKLVYAKGFGDAIVEQGEKVEPYHLFRLASMSKLITAVGIMTLVENGDLALDDKVFGKNGILNDKRFLAYRDKRVEDITVKHLLNHSGGWTSRWGDPMFIQSSLGKYHNYSLPLSEEDIIEIILKKRLHFKPGGASYYSNFGFMVLGKVIEKVSGLSYESYIQRAVLMPLGLFDMQLASNLRDDKAALEVNYYEQADARKIRSFDGKHEAVDKSNGGNNYETLGAAGAWIASSTDMLKLLNAIDGFNSRQDILSEESIRIMTENDGSGFSPLGWRQTNRYGWIRTGSFAGSSTVLKRRPDGLNFVVLCNTSTWVGPDLPFKLAQFVDRELNRIREYPATDLWSLETDWALK